MKEWRCRAIHSYLRRQWRWGFNSTPYLLDLGDFVALRAILDALAEHINASKPELNPICYLLALLGAHRFLHVSRIRVKLLTLR